MQMSYCAVEGTYDNIVIAYDNTVNFSSYKCGPFEFVEFTNGTGIVQFYGEIFSFFYLCIFWQTKWLY